MNPQALHDSLLAIAPKLADHLWQSTLFAAATGALTLALRKNQARIRYSLWLAASIKFLIPFSLLVAIGTHLAPSRPPAPLQPNVYLAMEELDQPFTLQASPVPVTPIAPILPTPKKLDLLPISLAAVWLCGSLSVLILWSRRWRRISAVVREALPAPECRELEILRRTQQQLQEKPSFWRSQNLSICLWNRRPTPAQTPAAPSQRTIPLLLSTTSLEPGIFGIFRPVLVWPEQISQRLDDAQLQAILAHEIGHVRRRDNLTATLHMLVEALFWFHPLVWWMGTRLVEERELACDEAVLELCKQPQAYAESILKVCEFCLESPLECVSGITGADLKQRIVHIMTQRISLKLNLSKKLMLAAAALLAITVPIAIGLADSPRLPLQSASFVIPAPGQTQLQLAQAAQITPIPKQAFEVASIRPIDPHAPRDIGGQAMSFPANHFALRTIYLRGLIQIAYGTDNISGLPGWADSQGYSVSAKVEGNTLLTQKQMQPLLQNLLEERFHLKVRREQKTLPGYALVVAKGGSKLQPTKGGPYLGTHSLDGFKYQNDSVEDFGRVIGRFVLKKPVADRTGLIGMYDIDLKFVPDDGPLHDDPRNANLPDIFTAIQVQLGLKLVPQKVPVDYLIIDHAEQPSIDGAALPRGQASFALVAMQSPAPAQPPKPAASTKLAIPQPAGVILPNLLSIPDIAAATDNTPAIEFDVVSIKENKSGPGRARLVDPPEGDGIEIENLTLFDIMRWNFNIHSFREDQLVGVPNWFTTERFDIQAKVADADVAAWRKLSIGYHRLVFRKLLVEQFKLAAHWANVEGPIYNLFAAKGGLKIKPVQAGDPDPGAPKGPDGTPVKGGGIFLIDRAPSGLKLHFQEISLSSLAKGFLVNYAGRQCYDDTGIPVETLYTFNLEFTPERSTNFMPGPDSGETSGPPPESGPSIFTALQEQLGLKLEPGKGPVGRLVIDHLERPSEN